MALPDTRVRTNLINEVKPQQDARGSGERYLQKFRGDLTADAGAEVHEYHDTTNGARGWFIWEYAEERGVKYRRGYHAGGQTERAPSGNWEVFEETV